jgi:hypothetical protein
VVCRAAFRTTGFLCRIDQTNGERVHAIAPTALLGLIIRLPIGSSKFPSQYSAIASGGPTEGVRFRLGISPGEAVGRSFERTSFSVAWVASRDGWKRRKLCRSGNRKGRARWRPMMCNLSQTRPAKTHFSFFS